MLLRNPTIGMVVPITNISSLILKKIHILPLPNPPLAW